MKYMTFDEQKSILIKNAFLDKMLGFEFSFKRSYLREVFNIIENKGIMIKTSFDVIKNGNINEGFYICEANDIFDVISLNNVLNMKEYRFCQNEKIKIKVVDLENKIYQVFASNFNYHGDDLKCEKLWDDHFKRLLEGWINCDGKIYTYASGKTFDFFKLLGIDFNSDDIVFFNSRLPRSPYVLVKLSQKLKDNILVFYKEEKEKIYLKKFNIRVKDMIYYNYFYSSLMDNGILLNQYDLDERYEHDCNCLVKHLLYMKTQVFDLTKNRDLSL